MANRPTLHKSHLNRMAEWLRGIGYEVITDEALGDTLPTQQVLRAYPPSGGRPFIVYARLFVDEQYTVKDCDAHIVRKYLTAKREGNA